MADPPPPRERAADVSKGKRFQLWGSKCSDEQRGAMLLDEVAVYSVTDARTADRITKYAFALPGGPPRDVCDGCACVGGNVASPGGTFRGASSRCAFRRRGRQRG